MYRKETTSTFSISRTEVPSSLKSWNIDREIIIKSQSQAELCYMDSGCHLGTFLYQGVRSIQFPYYRIQTYISVARVSPSASWGEMKYQSNILHPMLLIEIRILGGISMEISLIALGDTNLMHFLVSPSISQGKMSCLCNIVPPA